jgi:hypothetical protein
VVSMCVFYKEFLSNFLKFHMNLIAIECYILTTVNLNKNL